MHMAWAVGTPVVALFGPTTEGDVEPLGEKNITLIAKEVECLRCHKEYCDTKKCMYAITPQMVLNAITGLGIRIQSWKRWKSRKSWKGQKYYAALWDYFAWLSALRSVALCSVLSPRDIPKLDILNKDIKSRAGSPDKTSYSV